MKSTDTLYEKLGDEQLTILLREFYNNVFSSDIIGPLFMQSEKDLIIDKQFCFLTQFLGGPPRYTEKYGVPKMRQQHLPHKITNEAKDEWLRIMQLSIAKMNWNEDLKIALYNCFPQVAQHMVNS